MGIRNIGAFISKGCSLLIRRLALQCSKLELAAYKDKLFAGAETCKRPALHAFSATCSFLDKFDIQKPNSEALFIFQIIASSSWAIIFSKTECNTKR